MIGLTKTIEDLNSKKDLIVKIDAEDHHITITYKGLSYDSSHQYMNYSSGQNADTIYSKIVSGYEHEKELAEQRKVLLTNDNRF